MVRALFTPPGTAKTGWMLSSAQSLDDFLTELAKLNSFDGQIRICADQADYIANFWRGIEAKQQVRTCEFEEVHAVALDDLSHVHEFTQKIGRARRGLTGERVACFCCRKMMADRANTANTRSDLGHFKVQAAFAEFFKTAKFVDMHIGMVNSVVFLHVDGDFGVSFNTGNGFNGNFLCVIVLVNLYS